MKMTISMLAAAFLSGVLCFYISESMGESCPAWIPVVIGLLIGAVGFFVGLAWEMGL